MLQVGLDRLTPSHPLVSQLKGAKVGLLAHAASVDQHLVHISRVLRRLDILPTRIFGPEHGYGGEAQDMIGVDDALDPSGAPIVSLYGERFEDLSPTQEQLRGLDVLLMDLCDVGSRYYTFVWTALLAVRSAIRFGIRSVILDRPNPIGGLADTAEGRPQDAGYRSFVGLEPIPIRHGLTVGELVGEMVARDGVALGPGRALDVVGVRGWNRGVQADGWDRPFVPPSPNMPTLETARVYPGGCLLEGTNLSEGRGTTRPFEMLGAPWLDGEALVGELESLKLPGFVARPITFRPTFHKFGGEVCGGIQVHVTSPAQFRPVATYVAIIALARRLNPDRFRFRTEPYEFVDHIPAFDLLTGSSATRMAIERDEPAREIVDALCGVGDYGGQHAEAVRRIAALDVG